MCGRFVTAVTSEELVENYDTDLDNTEGWEPTHHVRPTDRTPIVVDTAREDEEPVRRLELARWSLVPTWSKELKTPFPTFNARAEGVAEKPAFKDSVVSRRALIPATGYYEWLTEGDTKTPHYIHFADDHLLTFAGLYSWWADPAKERTDPSRWVLSATILTMNAVPSLAGIHDRAPVLLPPEWWDTWLDPTVEGDQGLVDAAVEWSAPLASELVFHAVGPLDGDGPQLIEPLSA